MTSPLSSDNPAPNSNCARVCIPFSLYDPELHTLNGVYSTEEECLAACECAESSSSVNGQSSSSVSGQSSSSVSGQSSSSVSGQSSSSNIALACVAAQNTLQTNIGSNGQNWWDVKYGNNVFVAGGDTTQNSPSIMFSADGTNWQAANLIAGSSYDKAVTNIAFNGSFFLAAGYQIRTEDAGMFYNLYKSTNGSNWTTIPFFSSVGANNIRGRMYYLGGRFVIVDTSMSTGDSTRIAASTNGENWNVVSNINNDPSEGAYFNATGGYRPNNLVYANGKYHILGFGAPTGTTPPADPQDLSAVTRVPVIAVSEDNCATWTIQTVNGLNAVPTAISTNMTGFYWPENTRPPVVHMTYGGGKFAAIFDATTGGQVIDHGTQTQEPITTRYFTATSTDGINWTAASSSSLNSAMQPLVGTWSGGTGVLLNRPTLSDFEYLNNKFIALSRVQITYSCQHVGQILCSNDGMTWASSGETNGGWYAITYGNNKYVAVGERRFTGVCESENTPDVLVATA